MSPLIQTVIDHGSANMCRTALYTLGFITLLLSKPSTGRKPSLWLSRPPQDCIVCLLLFLLHLSAKIKGERRVRNWSLSGHWEAEGITRRSNFSFVCHIFTVPSLWIIKDGLVKANMEKLTFYALSAPEKLDRIGAYLSERLSRDVARHRYG